MKIRITGTVAVIVLLMGLEVTESRAYAEAGCTCETRFISHLHIIIPLGLSECMSGMDNTPTANVTEAESAGYFEPTDRRPRH